MQTPALHAIGTVAAGRRPVTCGLIRSASLHGYADLVKSLGHDPAVLVRAAGLSARLLDDPETLIPIHAVRELL
ncbi:MAG: AraC family transcriptional regulator, partial [Delftia acidovorans]|nr:AraC family transcriptional regulator [Delftia acidovorans]